MPLAAASKASITLAGRHSSLGYLSPTAFETTFHANKKHETTALHSIRGGPLGEIGIEPLEIGRLRKEDVL